MCPGGGVRGDVLPTFHLPHYRCPAIQIPHLTSGVGLLLQQSKSLGPPLISSPWFFWPSQWWWSHSTRWHFECPRNAMLLLTSSCLPCYELPCALSVFSSASKKSLQCRLSHNHRGSGRQPRKIFPLEVCPLPWLTWCGVSVRTSKPLWECTDCVHTWMLLIHVLSFQTTCT